MGIAQGGSNMSRFMLWYAKWGGWLTGGGLVGGVGRLVGRGLYGDCRGFFGVAGLVGGG